MSDHTTKAHLEALRTELRTTGPGLPPAECAHLEALLDRLEADDAAADPGLAEYVNRAAEGFEAKHPSLSAALRSLGVNLANIGI
ncbi:DUF4404 family protein [Streptomyces sp. NPDC006512]|uniref:DUF4404 family protein n=1 Tax=Streptomyces sp. NPDC006512 TaxID=3154307 RepID=UPI0033B1D126